MTVSFTTQIMAIGLTVSQLLTAPAQKFQRHFDPKTDLAKVAKIMHDGCNSFGVPLAPFVDDAVKDVEKDAAAAATGAPGTPPAPVTGVAAKIKLIDWKAFKIIAHQLCDDNGVVTSDSPARLPEVIAYFNDVFKDVDDITYLKTYHPPSSNSVLDGKDGGFTDMFKPGHHRTYVSLAELPAFVPQAFVSAEDKMFYRHGGIDSGAILRAGFSVLGHEGKAVGGSTIPQQMIKNVTKKADQTFDRKMREMYLASLATEILTKNQILEIYLNIIPLGRGTVGIGQAARVYFNKSASQLTVSEVAALAGMNQGPDWINPDKRPQLVEKKRQYVLTRMAEDVNDPDVRRYTDGIHARVRRKTQSSAVLAAQINDARTKPPTFVPRPRPTAAFYFVDEINRQVERLKAEKPELKDFDQGGFVVHSTIDPKVQAAVTLSVQDGLANLERRLGRANFTGRVGSLKASIDALQKTWRDLLPEAKADKYYDVLWPLAVVLPKSETGGKVCKNNGLVIGTKRGTLKCLNAERFDVSVLKDYDLVFVRADDDDKANVRLMIPPEVQGSTIVIENLTGRVLGLSGGFSYGASTLNRATKTRRQPGSTMKPFTYLFALTPPLDKSISCAKSNGARGECGYQPNTLLSDMRKTIVGPDGAEWNPRNYDLNSGGMMPMRVALENSINVATANLASLLGIRGIQALTTEMGLPPDADNKDKFPFVLGAQPMRLVDMARAYATIANLGLMPREVYFIEGIERDNRTVWTRQRSGLRLIHSADRVAFYQLRSMMAGVVTEGTASAAMKDEFGGLVAAKTGTSEKANDAWFIGITNEYTVATWVGYDNGKGEKHRTLGDKTTGAMAALPIAQRVLRYLNYNPKSPETPRFKKLSSAPLVWDAQLKTWVDGVGEIYIDHGTGQFADQGVREVLRLKDPHQCAVDRKAGRDDCELVDTYQSLVQPGDLQQIKQPMGDGDLQSDSEQGLTQPNETRDPDNGYQPYEPDRGQPTLPRYEQNYRSLEQQLNRGYR